LNLNHNDLESLSIMVLKRLTVTLINIFCPPLAVILLCGPETDFIINCLLFLAGVIPSHLHAVYISWTYFNRKRKVRKGVYPGKWRRGIYSAKVQKGGASNTEIARLKREMAEGKEGYVHHYDGEWSEGRSKIKTRTSGYGSEAQQVPGRTRTRTRNRRYELDRQQALSRSRTRSSG
jgi:uncharacterized membrane protein YqaE (UPF0057 family)